MVRLISILILLVALVAAVVAWSADRGSTVPADFSFINRGDNKTLDPNQMSWMQDIRIAYALWEGLYTLDPVTLKPVLGTADRADVDSTHTVWTLHIRENAKWTNGDPVLADDFLFSWRRFLETPGDYTYLHFYIRGAKEYSDQFAAYLADLQDGKKATPPNTSMIGEEKLDDRTLRVTLTNPIPFFPALCAFSPFFPMNEKSMEQFADTESQPGVVQFNENFTHPPYLVTNGPYRLAEWSFHRRLRLVANDYYWNRASVKSRIVDQIYDDDPLAAFRAYERREVDWLSDVDPSIAQGLLKEHRTDLHTFPAFGTYFYSFNCQPTLPDGKKNPLVDVRVRQALSMAIDKEPIVKNVGRLNQPITENYIPPGVFPGFKSSPGLPYDVAKAKKLLAEAGYPDGKGFPQMTVLYNTDSVHGDIAQIICRQWADNLGISVSMEGVEIKVFGKRLHEQDYEIARASWYGDYDDPSTFTDKYKSDSDNNDSKWSNAEYDHLCALAEKELDPQKRFDLLAQAEGILLKEAPIMPLYTYVNAYMFRDNVHGLPLSAQAMLMFQSVKVDR